MMFPLRRELSAARLRRGLSTAVPLPPWVIIHEARLASSPGSNSGLLLRDPPGSSHLLVPAHLVNPRLHPDAVREHQPVAMLGGMVRATSGDGLLLLQFVDVGGATAAMLSSFRAAGEGELFCIPCADMDMEPDITRIICNPISCELFRVPGIDGTKKVPTWKQPQGLLTQSVYWRGPPDRYAIAELSVDGEGEQQRFVMWRFLSETGAWEKLEGLPSPLPLPRRINMDHEVVAFAGRLYWVDLTWGAVSADPFADRPELRFLELPRDSVWPVPAKGEIPALSMHRRVGVSEGKLRYVQLSQKDTDTFLLSSFVLEDDHRSWTLEHMWYLNESVLMQHQRMTCHGLALLTH